MWSKKNLWGKNCWKHWRIWKYFVSILVFVRILIWCTQTVLCFREFVSWRQCTVWTEFSGCCNSIFSVTILHLEYKKFFLAGIYCFYTAECIIKVPFIFSCIFTDCAQCMWEYTDKVFRLSTAECLGISSASLR